MKRAYAKSKYAKPCERYCREVYPEEAEQIFQKAETYYLEFMKDMPDLGENMMAKNMLDWFTILAFYEASGHRMDGEALLEIKRRAVERMRFLGKLVDGNRQKWPYRLFEKTYANFIKMQNTTTLFFSARIIVILLRTVSRSSTSVPSTSQASASNVSAGIFFAGHSAFPLV